MFKPSNQILLCSLILASLGAHAQIVTSRFVSSDPLDNPAAAIFRKNKGIFVIANRDENRTTALHLLDSTLGISTDTNTILTALLYQASSFFVEANLAFQNGTKVTRSTRSVSDLTTESTATSDTDSVNLLPIQTIAAFKLGNWGGLGLKLIQATATGDTKNSIQFVRTSFSPYGQASKTEVSVDERNSQKNKYQTLGVGGVFRILKTGILIGAGTDLMQLDIDQNAVGVSRTTNENNMTTTTTNSSKREKLQIVKELYGISYLRQSSNAAFRAEISHSKMPPLDSSRRFRAGHLSRSTIEVTWKRLSGGIEASNRRGYFVDPNNLIPIYFNFAHLTDTAAFTYGFFGGFNLSAGHSFSVAYFQSKETKEEQLFFSDPTRYAIERKARSIGFSYSYVF